MAVRWLSDSEGRIERRVIALFVVVCNARRGEDLRWSGGWDELQKPRDEQLAVALCTLLRCWELADQPTTNKSRAALLDDQVRYPGQSPVSCPSLVGACAAPAAP